MKKYISIFYCLIIALFGLMGMRALFHPGFYTSLDGWHNIARLYHYQQILGDGIFPPRWSTFLANGYGYPLFVFSYHAPWIMAEPLLRLGINIFDTIKIILIGGFILSGITMYLWAKEMFGRFGGLISGIIYMWAPYRFAKILVGASVGEATVFMFLPLLFWSMLRLKQTKSEIFLVLGATSLALVIMSHLIILPIISLFFLLYTCYLLYFTKNRSLFLRQLCMMIVLGLGLASFYFIPLLSYSSIIKAQSTGAGFSGLYQNHFVNFPQLLYSRWGFGPIISSAKSGEISFQIGVSQWMAVIISLSIIVFFILHKMKFWRNLRPASLFVWSEEKIILTAMLLTTFTVAILMMIDASRPIWEISKKFMNIDYPWRFQVVTTLIGSLMAGLALSCLRKGRLILAILLVTVAVYTNRNHLRVNQYTNIPLSLYVSSETTTNTFNEYLPLWTKIDINHLPTNVAEANIPLKISNRKQNSQDIEFTAETSEKTNLKINQIYFPGHQVVIDGNSFPFRYHGDGRISLDLPQGRHKIMVRFGETKLMKISDYISAASALIILFLLFRSLPKVRLMFPIRKRSTRH